MTNLKELATHLADELEQAAIQLRQYRAIKSAGRYEAAVELARAALAHAPEEDATPTVGAIPELSDAVLLAAYTNAAHRAALAGARESFVAGLRAVMKLATRGQR
jgi:hypothetical protein